MQRVFDKDNEKDMADLWDILPDKVSEIRKNVDMATCLFVESNYFGSIPAEIIKINWRNKTEIFRPVREATKEDIGKLCKFWDKKEERESIVILSGFEYDGAFVDNHSWCWSHCRRLTKQEIEELC